MAPKKKDKEIEVQEQKKTDQMQADHEMVGFLAAFEKPTQIYRYLRTRNMISPMFLIRNLSYMRQRQVKSAKLRKDFKIDSMLDAKLENQKKTPSFDGKYLTLTFLAFNDKEGFDADDEKVKLDVFVVKKALKKRKDISDVVQTPIGAVEVTVNNEGHVKVPILSVPTSKFDGDNYQLATYSVWFRIETMKNSNGVLSCINGDEPTKKKFKTCERTYSIELAVIDRNGPCLLNEGEYDMIVQENINANPYSPKKLPSWEAIQTYQIMDADIIDDFSFTDTFSKESSLKFRLQWTNEPFTGIVEYPQPITACETENKENIALEANSKANNLSSYNTSHNNNNNNNNNSVVKEENKPRIIYQFVYNNNSRQQTDACADFNCPWCSLDCKRIHSLIKHLKLCHARFIFNYFPIEHGGARIDVSINENYDGSYTGSPHDLLGPSQFCRTPGPKRRSTVTNILVCRTRRNKGGMMQDDDFDENDFDSNRPYISGHNRLYHHTMTCLPVLPKELDIDSEGECAPSWLQQKTMQMIDEFTDVNAGEKELMKMWNLHVMRNGFVGDVQIPLACSMFLESNGKTIVSNNLYRNFIIHMSSLFDYGLISPEVFYQNVQKLQEMLRDDSVARQKIRDRLSEQAHYWKTVGIHKHNEEQKRHEERKAKEKEEEEKRKLEEKEHINVKSTPGGGGGIYGKTINGDTATKSNSATASNNVNTQQTPNNTNGSRVVGKGRSSTGKRSTQQKYTNVPSANAASTSKQPKLTHLEDSQQRRRSVGSIPPLKNRTGKLAMARRRSVATVSSNILSLCDKLNPKIVLTRNKTTQLTNGGSAGRTRNSMGNNSTTSK